MKIVVLDGITANPGDLTWDEFAKLGNLEVFERTNGDQIVERLKGAEIAITNKVVINRDVILSLPSLRYIGVTATGYNIIDTQSARERGIIVCNVPEYGTKEVAQAVFALLLELTNHTGYHATTVRAGKWSRTDNFCYWDFPLVSLSGLTLGIIGHGRIGRAVEQLAMAFGMKVIACRRGVPAGRATDMTDYVELDTLLRNSDVVSLHCPLTPDTDRLINANTLSNMKRTAFLINTARGALVDEISLANALNRDLLAGAGLDVLSVEPPPLDNPLLSAKNCIITPHIAWATQNSRARLLHIAAENLRAWLEGVPTNIVNCG